MPNTLEQSLELLRDTRRELDLLFPKTKLRVRMVRVLVQPQN